MKALFGLYEDKHNNYDEFIDKKISPENQKVVDAQIEELSTLKKYKFIYNLLRYLAMFLLAVGFSFATLFMFKSKNKAFDIAFNENGVFFILEIIFLSISIITIIVLIFIDVKFVKKKKEEVMNNVKKTIDICYLELGVPINSHRIDIIRSNIVTKEGEERFDNSSQISNYLFSYAFYKDDEYFYITSVQEVIRIPLSFLRKCTYDDNQTILVPEWLKFESYNEDKYKFFILKEGNNFRLQGLYTITLENEKNDIYFFIIPGYEKDVIEEIILPNIKE